MTLSEQIEAWLDARRVYDEADHAFQVAAQAKGKAEHDLALKLYESKTSDQAVAAVHGGLVFWTEDGYRVRCMQVAETSRLTPPAESGDDR